MNCYAKLRNKVHENSSVMLARTFGELNLRGTVRSNPAEDQGRGVRLSKSIISVKDRHPVS
jgi:hypothetical protein